MLKKWLMEKRVEEILTAFEKIILRQFMFLVKKKLILKL